MSGTRFLLAGAALAVAGCQPAPGPGQNVSVLNALPQARVCVTSLPPFGRWQYAHERVIYYVPPNASLTVDNDGAWCQIMFQHWWGGQPLQAPLSVITPPAHGEAVVGSVGVSLRIAYRPAPGFSGRDSFVVHLTAPEPWDIAVPVSVMP